MTSKGATIDVGAWLRGLGLGQYEAEPNGESRLRKSAQDDKWSFCLTAGTLCPTNQERN
jgi:hypothetical protein